MTTDRQHTSEARPRAMYGWVCDTCNGGRDGIDTHAEAERQMREHDCDAYWSDTDDD